MAKAKTVTVVVSPNTSVIGPDGVTVYRAGETFDVADDDTAAQWLTAGAVAKVSPAKRRSR